jgi:PAS domain S-box-containing protein
MNLQLNAPLFNAGFFSPRSNVLSGTRVNGFASNRSVLLGGFLLFIGYYLGAKLGISLKIEARPVSVMWPPNAILLAALLLTPTRSWWFLLLCAFPAHLAVQLQAHVPPSMMLCWFISNSAEALLGAGLIRWAVAGPFRLAGLANIATFLTCGAFVGPFLSSFVDAAFVRLNDFGHGTYWEIWRIRFFSNVLASLTVAPMIVMWAQADYLKLRKAGWKRFLEAALLVVGLLVVGDQVFAREWTRQSADPAFLYTPLPFLLWAAVRFGGTGAVTAVFLTSLVSIWGAAHGGGPFLTRSPEANALSLQMFLVGSSVLLLLLCGVVTDREHAQERFAKAFHSSPDAILIARKTDGQVVEWNERAEKLFGYARQDAIGRTIAELNLYLDEADRLKVTGGTAQGASVHDLEIAFRARKGEIRRTLLSADSEEIAGADCLILVIRDISERHRLEEETSEIRRKLINAQEDERKRIARDLHDDLNQRLSLLAVEMDVLGEESKTLPGPTAEHLESISSQLREITTEVHRFSYQLHPLKLEQLGLIPAAESFCRDIGLQWSVAIRFEHRDVPPDLDSSLALCLYRVLQEALQNAVRHSDSSKIHVQLVREREQPRLRLSIIDYGKGFDPNFSMQNAGLGLVSMRERVRQVHGSIQFHSNPGAGTRIEVSVPLQPA